MVFGGIIKAFTGAQASDDLRDGATDAMGLIEMFARRARGASDQGFDRAIRSISKATDRAVGAIRDGGRGFNSALQPYRKTGKRGTSHLLNAAKRGTKARNALSYELGLSDQPGNYSGFERSPGQEFALEEATRAINASAAAQGGFSGNTLRDIASYSTGLAQQDYGNHINRLLTLAQQGQGAAGTLSNQGFNASAAMAANDVNQGNALARLYTGEGAAVGGLQQGQGAARAGSFGAQGNTMANLMTQRANADASGKTAIGDGIGSFINDGVALGAFAGAGGFSGLGNMFGNALGGAAAAGGGNAFNNALLARMGG